MSLYLETEGTVDLPFDAEETAALVADAALEYIGCPYEAEVDLLLTHDEEIREMNREHRNIDRPTDVLSFPMLEYETPGDFSVCFLFRCWNTKRPVISPGSRICRIILTRSPGNCSLGTS